MRLFTFSLWKCIFSSSSWSFLPFLPKCFALDLSHLFPPESCRISRFLYLDFLFLTQSSRSPVHSEYLLCNHYLSPNEYFIWFIYFVSKCVLSCCSAKLCSINEKCQMSYIWGECSGDPLKGEVFLCSQVLGVLFCFVLGPNLVALRGIPWFCTRVTSGSAQGTVWDVGDWTQIPFPLYCCSSPKERDWTSVKSWVT